MREYVHSYEILFQPNNYLQTTIIQDGKLIHSCFTNGTTDNADLFNVCLCSIAHDVTWKRIKAHRVQRYANIWKRLYEYKSQIYN